MLNTRAIKIYEILIKKIELILNMKINMLNR